MEELVHGLRIFWQPEVKLLREFFVVGVSCEVATLDHFKPGFLFFDEIVDEGFLEGIFGTRYFIDALVSKVDFDRFPSEFIAIFIALDSAIDFQLIGIFDLERLLKSGEGFLESL